MYSLDFSITNCDVADMITETSRFMFHIYLIHVVTCIIDGTDDILGNQVFKLMFITAMSVVIYHILFKKLMNVQLKPIQSICKKTEKDSFNENMRNTNKLN